MFRGDSYIGRQNTRQLGLDANATDDDVFSTSKYTPNPTTSHLRIPGHGGLAGRNMGASAAAAGGVGSGFPVSGMMTKDADDATAVYERAEKMQALAMINQEIAEMSEYLAVRKRISAARKRRQELQDALLSSDTQTSVAAAEAAKRRCTTAAMAARRRIIAAPELSNSVAAATMNSHGHTVTHYPSAMHNSAVATARFQASGAPSGHRSSSMPLTSAALQYQPYLQSSTITPPSHFASTGKMSGGDYNKSKNKNNAVHPSSALSSDLQTSFKKDTSTEGRPIPPSAHPSSVEAVAIHCEAKASVKAAMERKVEFTMPTPQDVLMGRGMAANAHEGNQKFLSYVGTKKKEYVASAKKEKTIIAQRIVDEIHKRGGRFLQQSIGGMWSEVGNYVAREKCSRALRDPENRDVMGSKNDAATSLVKLASKDSNEK